MSSTLALEEFEALQTALTAAKRELILVRAERDLLQEQLNKLKRDLFSAKSEAGATHQKDLFFNEAEDLGAAAQPAVEENTDEDEAIDVPAHKRTKRGRKPIDPCCRQNGLRPHAFLI